MALYENKSFSLIELIIVAACVGILAAVFMGNLREAKNKEELPYEKCVKGILYKQSIEDTIYKSSGETCFEAKERDESFRTE